LQNQHIDVGSSGIFTKAVNGFGLP
jgi:hypothetical protein